MGQTKAGCPRLSFLLNLSLNAYGKSWLGAALFVLGSLVGAVANVAGWSSEWIIVTFSFVGVLCLLYATYELINESRHSFQIVKHHLDRLIISE